MVGVLNAVFENKGLSASIGALIVIFLAIGVIKWFQELNKRLSE